MSKILLEKYLEGEFSQTSSLGFKQNIIQNIASIFEARNQIENTGKKCVILPSEAIDLII